jgi:lysophospholipase L1-like esterase
MLGDEFDVLEAGLGGRTTAFDWPPRSWRSGRDLIAPTLETHSPLDVVIILLGTNDVAMPHLSVNDIARGAGELITIVRSSADCGPRLGQAPAPLLVAPHVVGPLDADDELASPDAPVRSVELARAYRELAARLRCDFVDLSGVVLPSGLDPWHWDPQGHQRAAELLGTKVRQMVA